MSGTVVDRRVIRVAGRVVPLRGDDVDTDRIMPARFLRAVSFEGLEAHVFEDDRLAAAAQGRPHPFDRPAYRGASVLVVNRNFGCGSSREHAPQALARWGLRAIVGESFSEIFFGNATMLGVPCVQAADTDVAALMHAVEQDPTLAAALDLETMTIAAGDLRFSVTLPAAAREALVSGNWDGTALLLQRFDEVRAVAARLPYVSGF